MFGYIVVKLQKFYLLRKTFISYGSKARVRLA